MGIAHYSWRTSSLSLLAVAAWALSSPIVAAQQQQQGQQPPNQSGAPIPAYHSPFASAANDSGQDNAQEPSPDTRPLAGARNLALAGLETKRSFWQPHFDLYGTGDSNAGQSTSSSSWSTWTSFSGGVDIQQVSGNAELTLGYTGGFIYSSDSSASNGVVQRLNLTDKYTFRRATITVIDQLSYLPEQGFGFGGLGGTATAGGGTGGLAPGFVANQTILTGRNRNLSNSSALEWDTSLTPRSSLTFSGGYSILRYFESSAFDAWQVSGRVGYNHQISPKSTVALIYNFTAIRYQGTNQSIDDHTAQFSYGRRVTGRLALQIAGGPDVATFRTPISTSATGSTRIYWSLNGSLQYQLRRNSVGLGYVHGVSGGSGALQGSIADTVSGSFTRQMSRTFSSGITAGYSRNSGLAPGNAAMNQRYSYWFTGATLSHPLSRTLGLSLSYQMQYQDSNIPFCIGPTCGSSVLRHLISVGVGWHERPLLF